MGQPRDAATVILLRVGDSGLETFLMRRVGTMAFAAGAHVFPGGRVEASDSGPLPWRSPSEVVNRFTGDSALAGPLLVAAIRETFEETGVLLAVAADGRELVPGVTWEEQRAALVDGRATFAQILSRLGAYLDPVLLVPWDQWVTPEIEERRYNTRFFVAMLPKNQVAGDASGESDHVQWLTPAAAVALHRRGQLDLLPPTLATLSALTRYERPEQVLAAAAERRIRAILPRQRFDGDRIEWRLFDAYTGAEL